MLKQISKELLAILFVPAVVFGRGAGEVRCNVLDRGTTGAGLVFGHGAMGGDTGRALDSVPHKRHHHETPKVQFGVASYYADKFEGRKTYTDEIFRQDSLTAASNTLPMHTWVKVTNLHNHKAVFVRINDKMHPRNRRLIDLSRAAAQVLGFAGRGLTRVRIDVLGKKRPPEADDEMAVRRPQGED